MLAVVLLCGDHVSCYSANVVAEDFSGSVELCVAVSVRVTFFLVDFLCLSSATAILLCNLVWPVSRTELACKINIPLF